ncbi:MAG: type II toxin-antitoxin system RelE/ParE family toxin [Actinomycetes bacterium]|jgi:phage-related protein|nr:type II toxin-antitoxin system RelE/ParE family toxin [Actinomycetes bacterium]
MRKLSFDWVKRTDGASEFMDFMDGLPVKDRAKLAALITAVEEHGLEIAKRMKWVKKLGDGFFEIRSRQASDIQRVIYFHGSGKQCIITHGFTKKSDVIPKTQIERAKNLRAKWLEERGQR